MEKIIKNFAGIFLCLVNLTMGHAQNVNLEYKRAIKISNQTSYEDFSKFTTDTDSNLYLISTTTIQILHPTIGYQWKSKNNNFHEIELTNFNIGKSSTMTEIVGDSINSAGPGYVGIPIAGDHIIKSHIVLKYEYIMTFRKMKEKKLVPSFGFAVSPYYKQTNYNPVLSNEYPAVERFFGARFFVTPRMTYYFSPKFFIDLNIPISVIDTYFFLIIMLGLQFR